MPRRTRRLCAQGESVHYRSGAVHERRHAPRDSSYKYPANLCSFRVLVLLSLGPLAHPRSAAAEARAQLSLLVEVAETLGRGPSESRVLTMRMPSLSLSVSLPPPPLAVLPIPQRALSNDWQRRVRWGRLGTPDVPPGVHTAAQTTSTERQPLSLLRDASDYIKGMTDSLGPKRITGRENNRGAILELASTYCSV